MKSRDALWGIAVVVVAVVSIGFGFGLGVYTDQAFPDVLPYFPHHSTGKVDTTELQQAIRVIEADYVDGNVDSKKLSHGTVQGLIASLNDPFSTYYDPDQYKRLQQVYTGHYTGIGIYLSFSGAYPQITRAEIQVPSVRSTVIADHILYVRIYQFSTTTTDEFHSALNSGLAGAKGMVLDLREDPGGFITEADHVISQFVVSGETFELRDRNGNVERHNVSGEHLATAVPLVVLADANSASAAEIVAGSLQVHHRAKLVGTVTFGKGSVQQDFPLSDGADIHLTVKRWYLPNGQTIDKKGLTPDVTVPLANVGDEFDVLQPALGYAKDTQLNAALTLLAPG